MLDKVIFSDLSKSKGLLTIKYTVPIMYIIERHHQSLLFVWSALREINMGFGVNDTDYNMCPTIGCSCDQEAGCLFLYSTFKNGF